MLMSELVGKEIVNLNDGAKMGAIGDTDLIISPETGMIESLVLPNRGYLGGFLGRGDRDYMVIPWSNVKKIGSEVIIVDMGESPGLKY